MIPAALFVSADVQTRTVTLPDGSEHALHFKQLPASEFRKFFYATQAKDEDMQSAAMAKLIAASLCNEDGTPALTFKQALQLTPAAEKAISEAVLSVNGLGEQGNG